MDPKSYIQSGILEQYVLGKLTEAEAAEVERFANKYPEIKAELEAIEDALKEYAMLHGKTPPPGVLASVLKEIETQQLTSKKATFSRRALSIVALLLLALGAIIYSLYQKDTIQQEELEAIASQLNQQAISCDSIAQANASLHKRIDVLTRPDTRPIIMEGTDLSPNAIASVYYNSTSQEAILNIVDLPEPPTDKQYQLWAIVDGTPVSAGVFEIENGISIQDITFIADAQTFAISLEKRGGNPTPTEVHLMGT